MYCVDEAEQTQYQSNSKQSNSKNVISTLPVGTNSLTLTRQTTLVPDSCFRQNILARVLVACQLTLFPVRLAYPESNLMHANYANYTPYCDLCRAGLITRSGTRTDYSLPGPGIPVQK